VGAAEKGIKIARASNGPSASLTLSGTHYPTTSFQSPRENVGVLTLSVSIPVFDGGLNRERVNEARSIVSAAKEREIQTRREIALEVQKADLDVESARKSLDASKVALKSAELARKLAQQRYEAQVALYLEVTDAQSALAAAQASVVDATYDLLTAQARLSRALSEPITR
jgi:outer membrane protein TolC